MYVVKVQLSCITETLSVVTRLEYFITIVYGYFIYIISRNSKRTKQIEKEPVLEIEPIVPKDYSYLKYARKPLHNKFKNKSETIKLKHKNRYDKRLNFRGILW